MRFARRGVRAAAASAALVACALVASTATAATAATKSVLRIGLVQQISPNPAKDNVDPAFNNLAYAPLTHAKPDGTVVAGLATSWRYVNTKAGPHKAFELTLRHDARFSDGTPVTADAVVDWLRYFVSANGLYAGRLGPNASFESRGTYTVRVNVTVPNPQLPLLFSEIWNWGNVASPQAAANPSLFATGSYGAGPYMMVGSESVPGDHYTFVPNPYYWDKKAVKFREVDVKVIKDPSSMLQALQSGQLDVAYGDSTTAAAAEASGFHIVSAPSAVSEIFLGDTTTKPLSDVRVRQAINYAIDRKAIVSALFGKWGHPISVLPTTDATERKLLTYYPYNPTKARSLLAAAGYPNGFTIKALSIGFFGTLGDPVMQAAAKYLDNVGIHLQITSPPTAGQFVQAVQSRQYPVYQLLPNVSPTALEWTNFLPKAALNAFGWADPVANRLYYQGFKAADPMKPWRALWTRVTTQAVMAPIAMTDQLYYVSKNIGGVVTGQGRLATIMPSEWYPKS